jgi:hypothetical protein
MTQAEFAKGWKLLLLQPWGWRYGRLTDQGQPTEEAKTQMEFYYDKLKWAHPEAWWKVAELYAQGKEVKEDKKGSREGQWPSVWELRMALQQINHQYVRTLPAPQPVYTPCPPEVAEVLRKLVPGWGDGHAGKMGTV